MKEAKVIAKACEAYMLGDWKVFRELCALLSESGKAKLVKALYVP